MNNENVVLVSAEFFEAFAAGCCVCKVLGPAQERIEGNVNIHEACVVVRRLSDSKEIVISEDYVF